MTIIVVLLYAAAAPIAAARWLRVAQREHYLAGETTKFAFRWWKANLKNRALFALACVSTVASIGVPWVAIVAIQVAAFGPLGLSMRGRTSRLVWTRRLKTLAATTAALVAMVIVGAALVGLAPVAVGLCAVGMPLFVDLALAILAPVERRLARKFVVSASERLERVNPTRVAITGSFGKTTIKGYVRHLVEGTRSVVASPASFNNTGGLSRTANEMLGPDTEVFIAEMGTYGLGEIRDLCSWVKPDIAVLCNIGPVHLERFGSLDTTVAAKAEIFENARTAIINIDAYGMVETARAQRAASRNVITCSAHSEAGADLTIGTDINGGDSLVLSFDGVVSEIVIPEGVPPVNAACAAATAIALDVPLDVVKARLGTLPGTDHRCEVSVSPTGVTVIDDTYNSNPAGAAAALDTLGRLEARRRVVVTPGMVELGKEQQSANFAFAEAAAADSDDLIIVGFTNRASLSGGATGGNAAVHHVRFRSQAVEWVRTNLGAGDAVLYENDLPDHYA